MIASYLLLLTACAHAPERIVTKYLGPGGSAQPDAYVVALPSGQTVGDVLAQLGYTDIDVRPTTPRTCPGWETAWIWDARPDPDGTVEGVACCSGGARQCIVRF